MNIAQTENKNFRDAWLRFKKNRIAYYSYKMLIFLVVLALIAPFIATDMPWYCKYKGTHMFPAFSFANGCEVKDVQSGQTEKIQYDIADWKHLDAESIVFAPIPYAPSKTDYDNSDYVSPGGKQSFMTSNGKMVDMPGRFRHWLGTNKAGQDVLSGLINGTRVSLLIGFISMGIASLIGIFLGGLAGYFGNKKLHNSRGVCWSITLGIALGFYYGFFIRSYLLKDALAISNAELVKELIISLFIFTFILFLFYIVGKLLERISWMKKQVYIPVDSFVSRVIEILISMPLLILIISFSAIAKEKSLVNVMVIIGLTSWTSIARLTRAEFMRVATLDYIQSAQALGFKQRRIIFRHALPNAIAPALVAIAFGVASAILLESALSFLGVGVPADLVTWGSLLNSGREKFQAWWLVIFPGFAIFVTVTVYNLLGEGLRDALDPRLKE
ncbi:MAG TPA: ABC transporter permease [Bacteroidia bacterium]|jgi:peptide/nickel transport system permease protein|nr:ABC transporter permease [Bacteroidia bacterium]